MTSFGYGRNLKLVMGLHYSIILFSYVVIIVLIFIVVVKEMYASTLGSGI